MQWFRRIGCFFGFHSYIATRESWFLYRQQQKYLEDPNYRENGENIVTVILCPYCHKRVEIKVNK